MPFMAIVVVVAATTHNPSIRGPTGELGTVRQLQFAQHRAHMGLHGLDGDEQFRSHLLVRVAARDQPHDLLLAVGQPVQFVIVDRAAERAVRARAVLEGGQHESRQFRREHGVALMHLLDGGHQVVAGNSLRHISLCTGADHGTDILRRIRHGQREEDGIGGVCARFREDFGATAVLAARHMHVQQHHVRFGLRDHRH